MNPKIKLIGYKQLNSINWYEKKNVEVFLDCLRYSFTAEQSKNFLKLLLYIDLKEKNCHHLYIDTPEEKEIVCYSV